MPNGKPNILVIWGDDIGISNLSCYSDGMMGYRTPNIDRIANEGMRFTDSYGEQSCTAGRAAFISGQSVYRTGMSKVGVPGVHHRLGRRGPDDRRTAQAARLRHRAIRQEPLRRPEQVPADGARLRRVLRQPVSPQRRGGARAVRLPAQRPVPEAVRQALPRGVLKCKATDEVSNEPDDPKFGPVGKQTIEDTGPLNTKRMETIDDDIADATVDYIKRQHDGGQPVLRVVQLHPHARLHPHQAREPRAGRAVAVRVPRHDDRSRQERGHRARRARRTRHRRRHHRHLLHRQRTASQQLARCRHHAVPQREGHQLGGRLPGPGDDPLARKDRGGQSYPTTSSSTTTGCPRCWLPRATPTSATS